MIPSEPGLEKRKHPLERNGASFGVHAEVLSKIA